MNAFLRIKIKPTYAFGVKGCPEHNIPPNATVEYTIKLIDCEKVREFNELIK